MVRSDSDGVESASTMSTAIDRNVLDAELTRALGGEMVPKFLATQDASGTPNVVPITTLDAADEKTLIFGELFIQKTKANLLADPRVCVVVLTEHLQVWTIRGRFREFVESGPYIERMNQKEMFRYNAYVGIRRVAVIDVEEVTGAWKLGKLNVVAELLPAKACCRLVGRHPSTRLPPRVTQKFARNRAVKVLAFQGPHGFPEAVPVFSLLPTRSRMMVFGMRLFASRLEDLRIGAGVAASVITMDPIAYQVKGVLTGRSWTPAGPIGRIRIDEVYSACPPLAGERVKLQEPSHETC